MGFLAMRSRQSWLSMKLTADHSMPSAMYSACREYREGEGEGGGGGGGHKCKQCLYPSGRVLLMGNLILITTEVEEGGGGGEMGDLSSSTSSQGENGRGGGEGGRRGGEGKEGKVK